MDSRGRQQNRARRAALLAAPHLDLNGIDFVQVAPTRDLIEISFLRRLPGQPGGVPTSAAPLGRDNILIEARGQDVRVRDVALKAGAPQVLLVFLSRPGVAVSGTLRIVDGQGRPPAGFDPLLSAIALSFTVDEGRTTDCPIEGPPCSSALTEEVPIDYLAKDYASFRRLMLDRLAKVAPEWIERNPADLGMTLVEILAHAADHLSYYQDAVATEAYLNTARLRSSVRRHARLLDYHMHEGCNARAWVCFEIAGPDGHGVVALRAGTRLLTQSEAESETVADLPPVERLLDGAESGHGVQVFETLHPAMLTEAHNRIRLYAWGADPCHLPQGATSATLRNDGERLTLHPGDVLIFEQIHGSDNGDAAVADPTCRHAVRLTRVDKAYDPLDVETLTAARHPGKRPPLISGVPLLEVEWRAEDALPFPLCLTRVRNSNGDLVDPVVARGNVVLADHGLTLAPVRASGDARLTPAVVPEQARYRPLLSGRFLTYRVPYEEDRSRSQPAAATLLQDPRAALPQISVTEGGVLTSRRLPWTARRDLLCSDRFARDFVVETESDGSAYLRFGDGRLGRRPVRGTRFRASFRVGCGRRGNVRAGEIARVVGEGVHGAAYIRRVRNPLPAAGGVDPEPLEQVRLLAPEAFKRQARAVTEADLATLAARHPDVQQAVAVLRWTGYHPAFLVCVDRKGGRAVDEAFRAEVRTLLEPFRLLGYGLHIEAPRFVPLEIALGVAVRPDYAWSDVEATLREVFGGRDRPGCAAGCFHPDRLSFAETLYLSQIIARASAVPGVTWVEARAFRRLDAGGDGYELRAGLIRCGALEIPRVDSDPDAPENGSITFHPVSADRKNTAPTQQIEHAWRNRR